jgi:hypothetical protein
VDIKKIIQGTFIGGFIMWVTAGVWHNLIMANLYANVTAKHEGIGILLIAYFILAFFMAYLFPKFYQEGSYVKQGLLFGAIIGILWVFPHELAMSAAHGEPLLYVFKNASWHMVEQGIGGAIIGLVYRKA